MFPTPIQKASPFVRVGYKLFLPVALVLWLLPLIGVALTSIRPASDLAAGNYFGMPSGFAGIENYTAVFQNSPIGWYILNSFKITVPTVIGAVALSCLTGFALATYKVKGNLVDFIHHRFCSFQCRTNRGCHVDINRSLVFRRNKPGWQYFPDSPGSYNKPD